MDLIGLLRAAKLSALTLQTKNATYKNDMLEVIANAIIQSKDDILSANKLDIVAAREGGKTDSFIDRLALNDERIEQMAKGVRQIIRLDDPIGKITASWTVESGLEIKKVRVPLGVIAIIYEARPNVTADAIALCIKSGNSVVLKGSKDAINSNLAIVTAIKNALNEKNFLSDCIAFIDSVSHDSTKEMLYQNKYIDVAIPRGGEGLKKFVLDNAKMPVIASAGGVCHVYVEKTANLEMATKILVNAKVQRPSTCNACEQLLIDRDIARDYLPTLLGTLQQYKVKILGDDEVKSICDFVLPATADDYRTEFCSLTIAVKIVSGIDEAMARINQNGTKHSEAIVTADTDMADAFFKGIDAACIYHNASTRFTDGFEFGYGAEMGISTQKLHIRGPIGLEGLTSEKYIIEGNGTIRK